MLKLEKDASLSGFTIRLREKERFFEPRLLTAFAFALFLHGLGVILFQVTPYMLSTTYVFPPIQVISNHISDAISIEVVTPHSSSQEVFSPPMPSLIPSINWFVSSQPNLAATIEPDLDALKSIEKCVWPKWQSTLPINLEEPRIRMSISGDLAYVPLISTDTRLKELKNLSSVDTPYYVAYHVQLDEKTGELFWYDRVESSGKQDVDLLTEKILLSLRFSPLNHEPVKGMLNFVVFYD